GWAHRGKCAERSAPPAESEPHPHNRSAHSAADHLAIRYLPRCDELSHSNRFTGRLLGWSDHPVWIDRCWRRVCSDCLTGAAPPNLLELWKPGTWGGCGASMCALRQRFSSLAICMNDSNEMPY